MAIWQCTIYLVPNECRINYFDNSFTKSLEILKTILPEEESWSKTICQYGSLDSTCLEFSVENGTIDEMMLRIDLRSATETDLNMICAFAKENGLWFKQNDQLIEPDFQNLINILKDSDAARFLKNPEAFFANIPTESEWQRQIEEKYGDLIDMFKDTK